MKMIGLIGGMSWESTVTYYQLINEAVKEKLGGLHSAKILLYSVDFAQIEQYQISGMWEQSAELLTDAAKSLEVAGADFIVICTNTSTRLHRRYRKHFIYRFFTLRMLQQTFCLPGGFAKQLCLVQSIP